MITNNRTIKDNPNQDAVKSGSVSTGQILLWSALGLWLTVTIIVSAIALNNRTAYPPIKEATVSAPVRPPKPVASAPKPVVLPSAPSPAVLGPSAPSPPPIVLRPVVVSTPQANPFMLIEQEPESGEVKTFAPNLKGVGELHIKTAPNKNYLVRVYEVAPPNDRLILRVFIRGGHTEMVKVPLGSFVVKFASGTDWISEWELFGPETQYAKADGVFTFGETDEWITTYSLTLYKVPDGNIRLATIPANEF